jgi:hypothetical protein
VKAAHCRVVGCFDMASRPQIATITIDRDRLLFSVRPLRRRRAYELPLATVGEMVVRRIIAHEVAEKRAAKRARRRGGRIRP